MKRFLTTVLSAILLCAAGYAQNYKVEIKNDSKYINIDELGLPGTMSVSEVLRMLPELLNRPGNGIFENYDIQMNGFSVGNSKEQFLSQTYLADVKQIQISEDPVSSYQSNGHGGSINFTLRPRNEGSSGKLNLSAYSLYELQPTVQYNYNRKKFSFYAWVAYDMYRPATTFEERMNSSPEVTYSSDTTTQKSDYQMARLFMEYKPTDKDALSVQLFETYSKTRADFAHAEVGSFLINNSSEDGDGLSASANLKYTHQFKNSKLTAEARYEYNPTGSKMVFGENRFYDMDNKANNFSGKLEYAYNFKPKGLMKSGSITAGANYKFNDISYRRYEEFNPGLGVIKKDVDMSARIGFVSPFFRTEWELGKWRLKLSAEYQMYNYNLKEANAEPFVKQQNEFTGKFIAGFQMVPHHHLRFLASRMIRRPSNFQIYPYPVYDVAKRYYYKGSPNINPELSSEIGLDYITDHTTLDGDFFMLNVNASYIHVDGILGTSSQVTSHEYAYPYRVYENNGTNNIFKASAMLLYTVGRLSISLTGTVFDNHIVVKGLSDRYAYYSLAILPSVALAYDWSIAASAIYASPVNTRDSELGQSSFVHLRVSKSWSKLILSLQGFIPLSARATDLTLDASNKYSIRRYSPYNAYIGLNASWQF